MKRTIFYYFLVISDICIWIFINIIPGSLVLKIIKRKPWLIFKQTNLTKKVILSLIWKRCTSTKLIASSCLSRAIITKIICDICRFPSNLNIGMTKNKNGNKVPHAWVSDPKSGKCLTPGLSNEDIFIINII